MRKVSRICSIMQILMENPGKEFSLGYFASMFDCAKSSISEDIKDCREAVEEIGKGRIETISGVKGGVKFVPLISAEESLKILNDTKLRLEEKDRMLGGGFLYTSDLMFDPKYAKGFGRIFAKHFCDCGADIVITVETKGIETAAFTAEQLSLPLAVIRHESKVSDGSTVSINFFSGSSDRIKQMSLSKRAIKPGSKAIIIDDFMRGGGSIKGICDMLAEFDCEVAATGVVLSIDDAKPKRVGDYFPLLLIDSALLEEGVCKIVPNPKATE